MTTTDPVVDISDGVNRTADHEYTARKALERIEAKLDEFIARRDASREGR